MVNHACAIKYSHYHVQPTDIVPILRSLLNEDEQTYFKLSTYYIDRSQELTNTT